VCLGQEEAKVAVLAARLAECGVDADALIAHIAADGDVDSASALGVDVHQWIAEASAPIPAS